MKPVNERLPAGFEEQNFEKGSWKEQWLGRVAASGCRLLRLIEALSLLMSAAGTRASTTIKASAKIPAPRSRVCARLSAITMVNEAAVSCGFG